MPRKGLSILEIIVSLIILGLTVVGLVNMFVSGERLAIHARSRVTGGELGRHFLDPLQMDVRQDTWDGATNQLRVPRAEAGTEQIIGNIHYTPTYTVSTQPNLGSVRKVKVDINWQEHSQ